MKKLILIAVLALTACAQPNGMKGGMECCKRMGGEMKESCCKGMMSGSGMKMGMDKKMDSGMKECCCKGMMSGSGVDMKDGKGMMCEKMMQNKMETKEPAVEPKVVPPSEHEQHH